jgi:hypothetical protein
VTNAIVEVIGSINGKVELTKEQTSKVLDIISIELVKQNQIKSNNIPKDPSIVRVKYASCVLNDALRKMTSLNGGVKYEAKNPGSRTKDAKLEALNYAKTLVNGDEDKLALIQAQYDARLAELNKAKAKVEKTVDMSVLGEDFLAILELAQSK